jgi:hypothetical protein
MARAQLHSDCFSSVARSDLARESSVGFATIRRAISGWATSLTAANDQAIRRALETAGVECIDENGGGPGVRLRKPEKPRSK